MRGERERGEREERERAKREEGERKKRETYSDEPVFNCSSKFFIREKSDYILRSGETHSYGETRKQDVKKLKIRRSVEFSSAIGRYIPWRVDG